MARNPLFFSATPGHGGAGVPLTADTYRAWLAENAVQWVAVADTPLSWVGRPEAALIDAGVPYLHQVWRAGPWRLYAVDTPQPLVAAPAQFTGQDAAHLTFTAAAAGDVLVRVRWSRWLTVTGGASTQRTGAGGWTLVHVPGAGAYTLGSSLTR